MCVIAFRPDPTAEAHHWIALLIAARPLSARAALVGSALAVGMFLTSKRPI
jgi:hypothetical protein